MNLLFIHGTFPGQLFELVREPTLYLDRHTADRTVFLTESDKPHGLDLAGVELVQFVSHRQPA